MPVLLTCASLSTALALGIYCRCCLVTGVDSPWVPRAQIILHIVSISTLHPTHWIAPKYLDKTALNYAKVFGMEKAMDMHGSQYSLGAAIFYMWVEFRGTPVLTSQWDRIPLWRMRLLATRPPQIV